MADNGVGRVTKMYHPSMHAPALGEVETFFERVFGRTSRPLAEMFRQHPPSGEYPTDYSTFTPIADVLFDTIDPKLYVLHGIQRYKTVERPRLKSIGWFVEGPAEIYRARRKNGIGMVDQLDQKADGEEPPGSANSPMPLYFTEPADSGLRYEFLPQFPFPLDHRNDPDWVVPPASDDDPLGIEFSSHHTLLTDQPARELSVLVDSLGGTVIHEGRDELLGATSTYVHVADSIMQIAVPDEATPAHAAWRTSAPDDTYYTIAWKVVDLDRVARHLETQGVGIGTRTTNAIVTDPETSIGTPWIFTTSQITGDPRFSS
jgi:hypothetical protein